MREGDEIWVAGDKAKVRRLLGDHGAAGGPGPT
jgi:hypothetical protein